MKLIAVVLLAALILAGCATLRSLDDPRTVVLDTACVTGFDPWVVTVALCGAALIHRGVLWVLDHPQPPAPVLDPPAPPEPGPETR